MNDQLISILRVAWPLIVIQLGLQIYAIVDIIRRKKTKSLPPILWIVIVVLGEILGPIVYLLFGRAED